MADSKTPGRQAGKADSQPSAVPAPPEGIGQEGAEVQPETAWAAFYEAVRSSLSGMRK